MCLGHADGEVAKALLLVPFNLDHSLRKQLYVICTINLLSNSPDLLLNRHVKVVQELEAGGRVASLVYSLGQLSSSRSSQSPVPTFNSIKGSGLFGKRT